MPSSAASPLQDLWSIVLSKVGASPEFGQAKAQPISHRRRKPDADLVAVPQYLSAKEAQVVVKMGIPSRSLVPLSSYLGIGRSAAAGFLGLDRATATRKIAKDDVLPIYAAESLLRLLELDTLARNTFATAEEAARWLRQRHPMLDGEAPLDLAKSSFGTERVKDILNSIGYGGVV